MSGPGSFGAAIKRVAIGGCLLLSIAFGVLSAPEPAGAVQLTIISCKLTTPDTRPWHPRGWNLYRDHPAWKTSNWCPTEGIGFDRSEPVGRYADAGYQFRISDMLIHEVRLTVSGAAAPGTSYSLRPCWDCAPIAELNGPEPGLASVDSVIPIPLNTTQLFLRVECLVTTCQPAAGLRFRNIEVDVDDPSPPVVGLSAVKQGWSTGAADYDWGWYGSRDLSVLASAADAHSGISISTFLLNGSAVASLHGYCGIGALWWSGQPFPCDKSVPERLFQPPLDAAREGWNSLSLAVEDSVQNAALPVTHRFALDTVAPNTPEDAVLERVASSGWTDDMSFGVDWRDTGEGYISETESGLAIKGYDLRPRDPADPDPSPSTTPYPGSPPLNLSDPSRFPSIAIPADGGWDLFLWTQDHVGHGSGSLKLFVGRDLDDPPAPQLEPVGWISRHQLEAGRRLSWRQPLDPTVNESGVCGYALLIDGDRNSTPVPEATISGPVTVVDLPAGTPTGSSFAHLRAKSCAGRFSATVTSEINVDGQAPEVRIEPEPTDWTDAATACVLVAEDGQSGVESIEFRLDSGAWTVVPGDRVVVQPGDGEHTLEFAALDKAGNRSATVRRDLRIDSAPPLTFFEPRDAGRPTRLVAQATDATSGLDSLRIEYRRLESAESWQKLAVADGGPEAVHSRSIEAEIPDDRLAGGRYEFRSVAADRAGNSSDSTNTTPIRVSLPLREVPQTRLSIVADAGRCPGDAFRLCRARACDRAKGKRCNKQPIDTKGPAVTRTLLNYGRPVALAGEVRNAAGEPVAGAEVHVFSAARYGRAERVAVVRTGKSGEFVLDVPAGPTRRFTARTVADARQLAAESYVDLAVRAGLGLRAGSRSVRVGTTIRFSGRLSSGGVGIPDTGKIVELQWRNGDTWADLGMTRVGSKGRFRLTYAFRRALAKPVVVTFRVLAMRESSWPFEDGWSRRVRVKVRP